jgi:mono/diheme cytochrome c family protein
MIPVKYTVCLMLALSMSFGCEKENTEHSSDCMECLTNMIKSPQRSGNPQKGKDYLLYGDIVDSGIPENLYRSTLGTLNPGNNELGRTGPNQNINYQYTLVTNSEKVNVVAPNCFQCHGGYVDGKFIAGLGNTLADFTQNQAAVAPILDGLIANTYGKNSKEYRSFEPFLRSINIVGPRLITNTVGSNAADKLALILAAHRDINTLEWKEKPSFTIPEETHPVDVPPLWNVKYKNALYYTGIGTGDFARQIMAASLLTMKDSSRAKVVDQNFTDVIAYINTLESPTYTGKTDPNLVSKGKEVYQKACQRCHGTYDANVIYPNLLVDHALVQTDYTVIQFYKDNNAFVSWYNNSWFSKGPGAAKLQPKNGYVAPPLKGIWASAPYFHNGSVPTLDGVIDSSKRPLIWQKTTSPDNYDHEKMGLKYTVKTKKEDNLTFDTNLKGHSNSGHNFGDNLSSKDKKSLLEYLKTL